MNKIILITNGKPRCGKDTFSVLLNDDYSVYKCSSVDKIKKIASYMGWNGVKTEKSRKFLSDLKMLHSEYNDGPFEDMRQQINWFLNHNRKYSIMIIDVREPKEIDKLKSIFDIKTVYINNDNVEHITSNTADANVDDYEYDYYIDNSGTIEEFKNEIKNLINDIKENI